MSTKIWWFDYEGDGKQIILSVCPGDHAGTAHIHLEDEKGEPISASMNGIDATDVAMALISYAYGVDAEMIRDALIAAVEPSARKGDESEDWAEFWNGE